METIIKKDQAGVPPGGTTGQGLIKNSGTDFDYDWGDLPSGPTTPSDISLDYIDLTPGPGGSPLRMYYLKTGKLYSFIFNQQQANGQCGLVFGTTSLSDLTTVQIPAIAAALGITVNTAYTNQTSPFFALYANFPFCYYNGSAWTTSAGSTTVYALFAILAN